MKEVLKGNAIQKYLKQLSKFSKNEIEDSLIRIFLDEKSEELDFLLENKLQELEIPLNIENTIYLFETLLEEEIVTENGIVFTPKYIADFICDGIWKNLEEWNKQIKVIDPGCGCGIFLVAAILYIHQKYQIKIDTIITEHIYGIELDENNVRRCKKIIKALAKKEGVEVEDSQIHILHTDSLKQDWCQVFDVEKFHYIIGNPPYVNTHDMSKDTAKFLKENFMTTKTGVYNIFYAFIEHAMKHLSENGSLSYIVPNNFLTIKSATDLRDYLKKQNYICSILDFGDNMVFKPVRTYNCIIILNKLPKEKIKYHVLKKTEEIERTLQNISYDTMEIGRLDKNGWNLVDHKTHENLMKIENQGKQIKDFIRTGIATLRDDVYMVEKDEFGYFKMVEGKRYDIDGEIVKTIFKIPELRKHLNIKDAERNIIFPYTKSEKGYQVIEEDVIQENYENTYRYLQVMRNELEKRDKGKGKVPVWYAYGRTQGLNKYGRKLLFPTFAGYPKFLLIEDESALFCNGYGIFENDYLELEELRSILNSKIMQYYVVNTSYAIEGGYYCYQKKYIEKFSFPCFDEDERKILKCGNQELIDEMLVKKYDLTI